MKQSCRFLLVVLSVALGGCGGVMAELNRPAAESTPLPPPTAAPRPTPSPAPALGLRTHGIIFHDLTQSERICPGFAEILSPFEMSPDQSSDSATEVVRQVRLVCTNDATGTVYVVDLENQTITATRKPPPVPGMP